MRPLGARQELLLRIMLQDTYRGPGLTCKVMLSLEKRGLVEKRTIGAKPDGSPAWLWYLTAEGEQAARVCKLKEQMSKKPTEFPVPRELWPKGTP